MWAPEDIFDISKGSFPFYLFLIFPLILIISPLSVAGSVDFPVFRLQQFELHGSSYGSQNNLISVEARRIGSGSIVRKCVIVRLQSLTPSLYQQLIKEGVAAVLILLPPSLKDLTQDEKQMVWELEETLVEIEVQAAVYFAYDSEEISSIHEFLGNFTSSEKASSAAAALRDSLSSNGYQMVVTGSQNRKVADSSISNIYGKLSGHGVEEQLPTIGIVAHYDSFAAAPSLAAGADSNGSGVIVLLEIVRIFSKLFSSPRTHPKMNLVFLLSGGGFINYQGSKRFLEDELDSSDSPLISELQFALCLDTLANGPSLNLHVSKKPKEDTQGFLFWKSLESEGRRRNVPVEMVHKKINLQDDRQSWEHEKFSIRRLPAFTVSRLSHSEGSERGSLTDTFDSLDVESLTKHASVIVSSLISHVYNRSAEDVLGHGLEVREESVRSWISLLSSQPRAAQMLTGAENPFVLMLQQTLKRYASEVKISTYKADARDPEWVFYDSYRENMSAYVVKPAFFDFLLLLCILGYLALVYSLVIYFPIVYNSLYYLVVSKKLKMVKVS